MRLKDGQGWVKGVLIEYTYYERVYVKRVWVRSERLSLSRIEKERERR